MPPTISVTVGRLDAAAAFCPVAEPLADELPELLQAARPAARTPTLAAAAIALREGLNMRLLLFSVWSDELDLVTDGNSGGGGFGLGRRPPGQQAPFQQGDQAFGGQRQDRDDEHGGEDAVGVEVVLRGG